MEKNTDIASIASNFEIGGEFDGAFPVTSGHIHDTWLSTFKIAGKPRRFIHQRINHYVFKSPEKIQENIQRISEHLKSIVREKGGDPLRETLTLVPAENGSLFHLTAEGDYWRTFDYIEGARTFDQAQSRDLVRQASAAFGKFQKQLDSLSGGKLHETIPDFHNTPKRFEFFLEVLKKNKAGRASSVKAEIDFVMKRADDTGVITGLMRQGEIPERVTHNDTKLNNVLFDDKTGKALCVIDLDTVMPGSALYDFGDSVRIAASTALEDEKNLELVSINLELFEALAAGYLESTHDFLSKKEKELLAFSARLITLEQGIRFLSDHLNGDVYYKVHRPNHNLDRARTQFRMVDEMERKTEEMEEIVAECCRRETRKDVGNREPLHHEETKVVCGSCVTPQ